MHSEPQPVRAIKIAAILLIIMQLGFLELELHNFQEASNKIVDSFNHVGWKCQSAGQASGSGIFSKLRNHDDTVMKTMDMI